MQMRREHASFNEVQQYVQDCKYPCSKEELISCAREHQAPFEVIQTLEDVKPTTQFTDVNSVKQNIEQAL